MRANIEAQLGRLLAQLSDLDELRAELDDDEYAETRRDTMEQIKVRASRAARARFTHCESRRSSHHHARASRHPAARLLPAAACAGV